MKPSQLVDRLLEEARDGGNLTKDEIISAYAHDYNGDMGLVSSTYVGPTSSGSHEYLALFNDPGADEEWFVGRVYVKRGSPTAGPDALGVDFAGSPVYSSNDRKAATEFFQKESHMKGHAKAVATGKQQQRDADDHEIWRDQQRARVASGAYRGGRGARGARWNPGDSPHWDGNRYAL